VGENRGVARDAGRRGDPPPRPEPLAVPVVDDHCHLDLAHPDAAAGDDEASRPLTLDAALAAAAACGIDRIVTVGTDVESSRWAVRASHDHANVVAAVALHPNEAPRLAATGELDDALAVIDGLAADPRVRAIGETGLDWFRTDDADPAAVAAQRRSFAAHVEIARRHGKTLQIHDRNAHADVLDLLDEVGAPPHTVLHCFSGDAAFARACVDRGYVLSFAGNLTFGNADSLRAAAAVTPVDQLQVETDAPFLTPMPYRGRPNASYLIPLTLRRLAEVTGSEIDALAAAVNRTTQTLYGDW
jgi:TatD DNase family protein